MSIYRYSWLIFLCLCSFYAHAQEKPKTPTIIGVKAAKPPPYRIKGFVFNVRNGEKIIGATIKVTGKNIDTLLASNYEGEYNLLLGPGIYTIQVTNVGFNTLEKLVKVLGPWRLNLRMKETTKTLEEVIVKSEAFDQNVSSKISGRNTLDLSSIKSLPPLAGEVDILKSLTLLPGVATTGETSSGFSVRGGGTDQNLILLGGAPLFNPSHLFGFFSSFNPDVVSNVSLYKGAAPTQYGGRASSVIDVSYKKGNFNHWEGNVSVGLVASRFSAGGPIVKDRWSIMTAGRIAYPNWLLNMSNDPNISNSEAGFYDANFITNYIINDKNDLEYSFYISNDNFTFASNVSNEWSNLAQVFKWNSTLSEGISTNITLIQSRYKSKRTDRSLANPFSIDAQVMHHQANFSMDWEITKTNLIKVGAQFIHLKNKMGDLAPEGDSNINPVNLEPEQGIEMGFFAQHDFDISNKFGISYGLRYSRFSDRGPATINEYLEGQPRSISSIIGTQDFDGGSVQSYDGFEPQIQVRYKLGNTTSVKGGFRQSFQYIHLITNTTSILPTDVWKLSDPFIAPQKVQQYTLGLFKNFTGNLYEVSLEGYYKNYDQLVEYRDGADLFVNPSIETELIPAQGTSYGIEFYLKKTRGRLFGWMSYTYARSLRTLDASFLSANLGQDDDFPANLDVPHTFNMVGNYRLGVNSIFSLVFTYSSGRPFTLPAGKFLYNGVDLPFFNERNNARAPSNHRLDMSIKFKIPSKKKVFNGDWTFAVYNVYGRANPFSVFFQDADGLPPQAFQLSIIANPFPTISYEVQF